MLKKISFIILSFVSSISLTQANSYAMFFDTEKISINRAEMLIDAVKLGDRKRVKRLIQTQVKVDFFDETGRTALDYAVEFGDKKLILDLVKARTPVGIEENLIVVRSVIGDRARHLNIVGWVVVFPLTGIFGGLLTWLGAYDWYKRKTWYPMPGSYNLVHES